MKTVINIKADREVKKKAQEMARELGLPLSTIVNAYLKEFIQSRKVTFSLEPQFRAEVASQISKAMSDYNNGKNISRVLSTADELAGYLGSL